MCAHAGLGNPCAFVSLVKMKFKGKLVFSYRYFQIGEYIRAGIKLQCSRPGLDFYPLLSEQCFSSGRYKERGHLENVALDLQTYDQQLFGARAWFPAVSGASARCIGVRTYTCAYGNAQEFCF